MPRSTATNLALPFPARARAGARAAAAPRLALVAIWDLVRGCDERLDLHAALGWLAWLLALGAAGYALLASSEPAFVALGAVVAMGLG